jgi:hypothetical protein
LSFFVFFKNSELQIQNALLSTVLDKPRRASFAPKRAET